MSRRRSALLARAALLASVVSCRHSPATLEPPADTFGDGASKAVDAAILPRVAPVSHDGGRLATSHAHDDDQAYASSAPVAVRSIGHTSIVFKIEFANGRKAAFKPASRRGPTRYKGELAARRLAILLGLNNVPPVFFRTFDAGLLAAAKGSDEMIVKNGVVRGALIPWVDGLQFLDLEKAPLVNEWKRWLVNSEPIEDAKRGLAGQISALIVFDFLTANWDRFSGGNVGFDKATGTLLYIDNDGAFFETPPEDGLARNQKLLESDDKLSRSLITHVRALDDTSLVGALGDETPGVPLLSSKAIAGVVRRRLQLLSIVDAKIATHGESETLAFP